MRLPHVKVGCTSANHFIRKRADSNYPFLTGIKRNVSHLREVAIVVTIDCIKNREILKRGFRDFIV